MVLVSNEMFERVVARARALAEEAFRRMLFDHEGMNPLDDLREQIIDARAERIVACWVSEALAISNGNDAAEVR